MALGQIACALLLSQVLVACIPIVLREEHVEPTAAIETVPPEWNPEVGPDLHMDFVYRFTQALRERSAAIVIVDSEALWRVAFPQREAGAAARVSEVVMAGVAAPVLLQGIDYLIVLGPERSPERVLTTDLAVFYSTETERTTREAVAIELSASPQARRKYVARAEGEHKEGWIPGTPLMFTRLYKTVDTERSALQGLAQRIADDIVTARSGQSIHVMVLGER